MESRLESEYSTLGSMSVSSLLDTDTYAELLANLPDEFYRLPKTEKDSYWRQVYHAATHGETDPAKLAQLYPPKK